MKRKCAASASCSSSSSSSLIESSPVQEISNNNEQSIESKSKPKRVRRAKKLENAAAGNNSAAAHKSRSSIYRGVTRHRWTGRYEAHLWDKTSWNSVQNKKGRQIYLGAYDMEEDAAHTYDLAALKYWGPDTILNFPVESYTKELEEMQKLTKEEFLATLRRRSSGFSRGVSKYRGVARHHHNGRWEARIGRVWGNKYLYLGTYSTQEEAAAAYDRAAIEFRGPKAVTNFDISNYADKLKSFLENKRSPPEPAKEKPDKEEPVQENAAHQPKAESIESMDSSQAILDPLEEHEHPWSLCLEHLIGLNSLQIPDEIPLIDGDPNPELELLDGQKGFEDRDIELMFDKDDGSFDTNEFLQDDDEVSECRVDEVAKDGKGSGSSSPSSSQCSNVI